MSITVNVRDNEWDDVGEWMWENRNSYNGIAVLPYILTGYTQPPLEDITEEQYNEMASHVHKINLSKVIEHEDKTDLAGEVACSGGVCELTY